jgi:hypothetical protein
MLSLELITTVGVRWMGTSVFWKARRIFSVRKLRSVRSHPTGITEPHSTACSNTKSAVIVGTLVLHARNSLFAVWSDPWYCSKHDSELSVRFKVLNCAQKTVGCFLCTFIIRIPPLLRSLSGWCRGFVTCCYSLVRGLPVLSYDGGGLTIGWHTWQNVVGVPFQGTLLFFFYIKNWISLFCCFWRLVSCKEKNCIVFSGYGTLQS